LITLLTKDLLLFFNDPHKNEFVVVRIKGKACIPILRAGFIYTRYSRARTLLRLDVFLRRIFLVPGAFFPTPPLKKRQKRRGGEINPEDKKGGLEKER
jgi:hypothetical protein